MFPLETQVWWKILEPRHKAMGSFKIPQSCLLEAEHGEEQFVTAANGKAGECDQNSGLHFTGKMILPERRFLLKSQRTKTFEASSGK